MSGRQTRRGRQSGANKRGQAGSVSRDNSAGRGRGASPSARGHGTRLSFFSAAGRVEPHHAEDLVEWMTKPSSSSSSSLTQAQGTGKAAAKASSSLVSMSSSVTPSLDQPCPPEESPELFEHSVGYMLQEDAQRFEGSDDDTQLEEGSSVRAERGDAQEGHQSGSHVPAAAAYCQIGSSDEEGGDDEVTDSTWVPNRREEEEEDEEEAHLQRGRMPLGGQRKGSTPTESHRRAPPVQGAASARYSKSSLVWAFFESSASDRTAAVCNICLKRISRGQNISRLGTTCLTRHMLTCHAARWQAYLKDPHQRTKRTSPCTASAGISNPTIPSVLSETCTERNEGVELGVSQPSTCGHSASSTPTSDSSRQISLPQLLDRRKKFTPSHPHAQRLNASLAKLLALQLLPFQLVDSAPFREFVQCAVPQWQVPKRHFFSRKAIPALYRHVEGNVLASLDRAVSGKVHITADSWSSRHGQGRYLSFTAHWVTLLAAGKDAGQGAVVLEVVPPPRLQNATTGCDTPLSSTPSSSSSSMASSCGLSYEPAVLRSRSRGYASTQAKRCHAVLALVCLGDRSHTGAEVLSALQGQAERWLTPRQLKPGMVVCDNGTNLLSALRQGQLTHVPCVAHVLNLVVQRFLGRYPGLQDVLRQARKVCVHFRRSYNASARLAELQKELNLPKNRLICDMPTRWNSTLAMLQRLHTQQRAINEYLCDYGTRTGSGELGFFSPRQWGMIRDACTVLAPFEEATRMVSSDSACISDTVPLVHLLEHTLRGIMDRALEAEQRQEEEDFLASQGPLYPDSVPSVPPIAQEEEEEEDCVSMEVEAGTQHHQQQSFRDDLQSQETSGLVRGWEEVAADHVVLSDPEDSGLNASANLRCMASLILQSLRKDPRILRIKERDHYWLATLLDPRYKGKVADLMLPSQREQRMRQLREALQKGLCNAFPETGRLQTPGPGQRVAEASGSQRRSGGEGGRLTDAFRQFFSPQPQSMIGSSNHRQRLIYMVQEYLGARSDLDTFPTENPLAYWVLRMDHWPELAQYAIELLACPASSVLSERTFSAAGGFVTDHRVRLSTDSVDRLTFIKMNQSWITTSYQTPEADITD